MITRTEIIYACSRLREDDTEDISEEVIDYIENAAIEKVETPNESLPTDEQLKSIANNEYPATVSLDKTQLPMYEIQRLAWVAGASQYVGRVRELEAAHEKILEWVNDSGKKDIALDDKPGMALYHIKWLATNALKPDTNKPSLNK